MSTVIQYPAKITNYTFSMFGEHISLRILGTEFKDLDNSEKPIADIKFKYKTSLKSDNKPFINRGGFLNITLDLQLLTSLLILLESSKVLQLDEQGTIQTES